MTDFFYRYDTFEFIDKNGALFEYKDIDDENAEDIFVSLNFTIYRDIVLKRRIKVTDTKTNETCMLEEGTHFPKAEWHIPRSKKKSGIYFFEGEKVYYRKDNL